MTVWKSNVIIALFFVIILAAEVAALKCYVCGTQTESSNNGSMMRDPCWEKEPFHEQYTLTCAPNYLCAKYITYRNQEVVTVTRGCTPRDMMDGIYVHKPGCGLLYVPAYFAEEDSDDSRDKTKVCFCDTDNCNKSVVQAPPCLLITLVSSLTYLLLYITIL